MASFRWKSELSWDYLEIWHSSKDSGAPVITYPYNPDSENQIWYDTYLSNGTFTIRNSNSWLALEKTQGQDHWDSYEGLSTRCFVIQTATTGTLRRTQQWWYRETWSSYAQRSFTLWSNGESACQGESEWRYLSPAGSTFDEWRILNVGLKGKSACYRLVGDGSNNILPYCLWSRG